MIASAGTGSPATSAAWTCPTRRSPGSSASWATPRRAGCWSGAATPVVHAALSHPGGGFAGGEGDLTRFVETNVVGTIRLIEEARRADVGRFVFISTCAVHDVILPDRPLDETHPTWAKSHYGAHKAAIEAFVSSFGRGHGYPICALRPTGIYGLAYPARESKWFDLIRAVVRGEDVDCRRGGKEVHALDVARAVEILLTADAIAGQEYNCYDLYIAEHDIADMAKEFSGSRSTIRGARPAPKHQIVTRKLQDLGMTFGGRPLLEQTVRQILDAQGAAAPALPQSGPIG
jgi:nucleoside-diphosphate-sugar epimerase